MCFHFLTCETTQATPASRNDTFSSRRAGALMNAFCMSYSAQLIITDGVGCRGPPRRNSGNTSTRWISTSAGDVASARSKLARVPRARYSTNDVLLSSIHRPRHPRVNIPHSASLERIAATECEAESTLSWSYVESPAAIDEATASSRDGVRSYRRTVDHLGCCVCVGPVAVCARWALLPVRLCGCVGACVKSQQREACEHTHSSLKKEYHDPK